MKETNLILYVSQRICSALAVGKTSTYVEDIPMYLHLHPILIKELSAAALLYALRDQDTHSLFLVGLLLANAALHEEQWEQKEKAATILLTAVEKDPHLENEALLSVMHRLFQQQRIPA